MATFILKWNPAISSLKMSDFHHVLSEFPFSPLNWSIWDHDRAHEGDDFYMIRVGEGRTGIVMSGRFSSEPIPGKDWSGKGRETYYCDLDICFIIHPDEDPILSTEQLEAALPDFDWRRGHSGLLLTEDQATRLDALFQAYKEEHPALADRIHEAFRRVIQPSAIASIEGAALWDEAIDFLEGDKRYTDAATHDCVNVSFEMDYVKREFRLAVMFLNCKILHLVCRRLYRLHTHINSNEIYEHEFELSHPYSNAYLIKSNGLQIFCGEIVFEKITEFEGDFIPVTI